MNLAKLVEITLDKTEGSVRGLQSDTEDSVNL